MAKGKNRDSGVAETKEYQDKLIEWGKNLHSGLLRRRHEHTILEDKYVTTDVIVPYMKLLTVLIDDANNQEGFVIDENTIEGAELQNVISELVISTTTLLRESSKV